MYFQLISLVDKNFNLSDTNVSELSLINKLIFPGHPANRFKQLIKYCALNEGVAHVNEQI